MGSERPFPAVAVRRREQGQGSIYQSADGTWHASLRVGRDSAGKRVRRHVQAATRRQAVAKLEVLRINSGPVVTVGDWMQTWMGLVERTLKWSTAKSYRTHVRYLEPLADLALSELTTEHIESVYTSLAERGVKGETIQSLHRSVRSCFGEAVKRGLMARNPVLVARPHRPGKAGEIQPLSVDEARAVLGAAAGTRRAARWQIALVLGLRQGEALGLQWADIDLEQATLVVRRALQRRSWRHGCQRDPCGLQAWRCPKRHSGGLVTDSPKSATSIRTVALPPGPGRVAGGASASPSSRTSSSRHQVGVATAQGRSELRYRLGLRHRCGQADQPEGRLDGMERAVGRRRSPRRPRP